MIMTQKSSKQDLRQNTFFIIASMVSASCNYVLYIACARILSPSQYGDLALVLAVSNQVLGALFATNLLSIYLVHTKGGDYARDVLELIQRRVLIVLLSLATMTILLGSYFAYVVGVQDRWLVGCLCLILLTAIPAAIWLAYFQANREFVRISIYNIVSSISKLILTSAGALFFGVRAALMGVVAGQVLGLSATRLYRGLRPPSVLNAILKKPTSTVSSYLHEHRNMFWVAIFSVLVLSFAQNIDILIANARLSDDLAGGYSAISLLSNALYYLGFLIIWLLLPRLLDFTPEKQKATLRNIVAALSAITILGMGAAALFGDITVKIFLGQNNGDIARALPFAVAYQITLIATALVTYFFILQGRIKNAAFIILSFVILGISSLSLFGKSITTIPISLLASLLCSWLIYVIIVFMRGHIYHGQS